MISCFFENGETIASVLGGTSDEPLLVYAIDASGKIVAIDVVFVVLAAVRLLGVAEEMSVEGNGVGLECFVPIQDSRIDYYFG